MATQVVRQRVESPERWHKALERALSLGIEVLTIAGSGEYVVTSASRLDVVYRCDGDQCECPAGLALDPCCCHRAAVRFVQGRLSCEPAPLVIPPVAECFWCDGRGYQAGSDGYVPCPDCNGSGRKPDTRPQGQPQILPVAQSTAVAA